MKDLSLRNLLFFLVIGFALLGGAVLEAHELQIDEYFDDNGILRQRTSYYGSYVKHGQETRWDASGRIYDQTEYRDGRQNGLYTFWGYDDDHDGCQFIVKSGTYVNDNKEGEWFGTSPYNGKVRFREEYTSGQMISAVYWDYREDGTLASVYNRELLNGQWNEEFLAYYENGNRDYKMTKKPGQDFWNCTIWYGYMDEPTGLKAVGILPGDFPAGYDPWWFEAREGKWTYYGRNGYLSSIVNYEANIKHGLETLYNEHGYLWRTTEYRHGDRHGSEKTYYGDVLRTVYLFANDFQEGKQEEYFSSGELSKRFYMKEGELHGKFEQWGLKGQPAMTCNYVNGLLDGGYKSYFENGSLQYVSGYSNGKLHGAAMSYYEAGGIQSQGTYQNDALVGTFTRYRPDGTIEYQETLQDGKRHGPYTEYLDISGMDPPVTGGPYIALTGAYCNGERCGTWLSGSLDPIYTEPFTYPIIGYEYVTQTWSYGATVYNTTNPTPYPAVEQDKEIRGRVKRADTGRPIPDVRVQIGDSTVLTDGTGYYAIRKAPLDLYAVSFTKEGFRAHSESVDMKDRTYKTVSVMLPPVSGALPAVTKVDSEQGSIFLQSIPIDNAYTAFVNWGGTSPETLRTVHFKINGTDHPVGGGTDGAVKTFNMGSDFIAGFNPKSNTLTITAENMNGLSPGSVILNPIVLPVPAWATALGQFAASGTSGGGLSYSLAKAWPEQPMEIQISQTTLGDTLWSAWGFFPLVGGREFGIPPTQFSLGVNVKTDGSGSVSVGGTTGFKVAGSTIEGSLKGTGKVKYSVNEGLAWTGTDIESGIKGIVKREVGPVELIPALAGATQIGWGVGRVFQWFNNTAKIDGAINVGTNLKLGVGESGGVIRFNPATGLLQSGIDLGLGSEVMGFKAKLSGGGTAKLTWQAPANPGYLKSAELILAAKLDMAWKLHKITYEKTHTFPGAPGPLALSAAWAAPAAFEPIARDFVNLGPYNQFVGSKIVGGGGIRPFSQDLESTDDTLVTNIYPYSEPAVAVSGGNIAIAYVYSDLNAPDLQATEIYLTYFDGTQFSTPAAILDDTRAEFAPTLAFDGSGKLVCVWERVKDPAFTATADAIADMERMAAQMEIVYAVYDPANKTWSAPAALTDNDHLDLQPMLRRGADGSLLLVWQSNAGNLTVGDAAHPTKIHAALWNASSGQFGAPVQSVEDFVNTFGFALAYRGPNALLAFVKDKDGDFATTDDEDIYMAVFDGSQWASSAPAYADTGQEVKDAAPQALFDSDGNPELVWKRQDAIVRMTGWNSTALETVRTDSASFNDFRLLADAQNRLVLLWQGLAGEKIDLFYRIYDPSASSWSRDLRLTDDIPMEKDFQGAFAQNGALHVVYNKEDRVTGENDLHHLSYHLKADLALSAAGLSTDPAEPLPGSQVDLKCRVENAGDAAFSNVAVDFYLGNPASDGYKIGSAVVSPQELAAGASGEASIPWTIPEGLDAYVVYATVDPGDTIVEGDEGNNTAFFQPIRPELEALQCRPLDLRDGSAEITAVVKNSGAIPALDVGVLFRANGADIGLVTLPVIKPGETAEISRLIWAGTDFTGEQPELEIVVDPDNKIPESDKGNNSAFALLLTEPKLMPSLTEVMLDPVAPGDESLPETILIRNSGGKELHITDITLSDPVNFSLDVSGGVAPLGGLTGVVPGGAERTVTVAFKPSVPGTFSATLTITTNDPDALQWVIPIAVWAPTVPKATLTVSTADHDFGNLEPGKTASLVIQLTNSGNTELIISGTTLSNTADYSLDLSAGPAPVDSLPASIPVAATKTFAVVFSPTQIGALTGELTISSNDPDRPALQIALQGTGVAAPTPAPVLHLTPETYFFGTVAPGAFSAPLAVIISNTGDGDLPVTEIALSDTTHFSLDLQGGSAPVGSLPLSIPAGENRTLTVTFTPDTDEGFSAGLFLRSSHQAVPEAMVALSGNKLVDPFLPGDIDGDAKVTLADAIAALKVMAGFDPAGVRTGYGSSGADVDGDGKAGAAEAMYILQFIAGLRP